MTAETRKKRESSKYSRIRRIILSRILVAPFIILLLVCGTLVYYFSATLHTRVNSEMIRIVDDHRNMIDQFLVERTEDLTFIANTTRYEVICRQQRLEEIFAMLQKSSPAFQDLGVFDHSGNHISYQGPYDLEGKNYQDAPWFKAVKEKSVYISDVFLGYRETPHFVIAVQKHENGVFWYLRATIDTLFFNNLVENIRLGKTGEAYLVNKSGIFQTKQRSGGRLMAVDPDFADAGGTDGRIITYSAKNHEGNKYRYAVGRLHQTYWQLVVRQDAGDAAAPLIHAVLVALGLIFLGGAVVVVIAFFLSSNVAHRLSLADAEKREMTNQLIMAGKLAEVGEMSSGIAHEINNPLQVMKAEVTMIGDLFSDLPPRSEQDRENFDLIKDSVNQIGIQIDRCRKITQGLLKFARKSDPVIRKISPADLLKDTLGMISHQAMLDEVSIKTRIAADLPEIESDPSQLQQVFLNLINNAVYAVRETRQPEVRIMADMAEDKVRIQVSDNGCGIPDTELEKIFLPFFTTKPVGSGTGLGLSTCFGIVENLGGKIEVNSTVGKGSTFTVFLPRAKARAKAQAGAGAAG